MSNDRQPLNHPWLIAVWPGMGHVAISAGYYLMSKLGMYSYAEYASADLFDVSHVDIKEGLIQEFQRPRSRAFVWRDPQGKRDLIIFIGEAQPPAGRYAFCRKLIEFAQSENVERVFTFAAMATAMNPSRDCRVYGAATDEKNLAELKRLELKILKDGQISGLNGVLLGVAAEAGLPGVCLLGEMPHFFSQFPYPKASLSVIKVFLTMSGVDVDLAELEEQAVAMDQHLGQILEQVQQAVQRQQQQESDTEEEAFSSEPFSNGKLSEEEREHLEKLFKQAEQDRSKAYELKRELDRLDVFSDFEDRFLDLFKNPE